jgi:hypothetical protein
MSPLPILLKITECQIAAIRLIRKFLEYVEVDINGDGGWKEMGQIMWARDRAHHTSTSCGLRDPHEWYKDFQQAKGAFYVSLSETRLHMSRFWEANI